MNATVNHSTPRRRRRRFAIHLPALMRLKTAAVGLMGLGLLLLLAGWLMPELWRPALAGQRPLAFALLGVGALLMWLHARREAESHLKEVLSSLTHSSLTPYEFAPVTLPMEDPAELSQAPDAGTADAAANATTTTDLSPEAPDEAAAPAPPAQWSAGLLRTLEWRRFEALCEEIFKQDGYVVRPGPRNTDGTDDSGSDSLWLHSRLDLQQPVRIVQCRNWSGEPVGAAAVREFLGAMVDAGLKSGALMNCGAFTAEAEALARRHGIMLISAPDLLALVAKRPEALQHELLAVATEGDYQRPTCRRCGLKMLARPTDADAPTQWVCEGFPRCPGTLEWSAGPA